MRHKSFNFRQKYLINKWNIGTISYDKICLKATMFKSNHCFEGAFFATIRNFLLSCHIYVEISSISFAANTRTVPFTNI